MVDGKVDLSTSERYISEEEAYGKYKHFLCDKGDFVVASSGIKVEYIDKKMGFIDESMLPLCMNTSTIRFKALDPSALRIRYFMYYLKSQSFKEQLTRYITGSAQLNYGPSHIKQMVMPWIPLESQDKLIERLDRVQVIIEHKEQQLTCLDKLVKSRYVEMFGEPLQNARGWIEAPLIAVAPIRQMHGLLQDEVWLLNLDAIESQTGTILFKQRVPVSEINASTVYFTVDSVLYSKLRPYLNKVVMPDENGIATSELLPMYPMPNKLNRAYLCYWLRSDAFVKHISEKVAGAKMPRVAMDYFRSLSIELPPLELQNSFAAFVAEVDKSKLAVKQSLEKLETLKKSLMQQYFG